MGLEKMKLESKEIEELKLVKKRADDEVEDFKGIGEPIGEEEYRKMESEEKEKSVRLSKEIEVWEEES
ncbi:hypothetical protein C5167_026339 [Papaver somniferum]|nr:hypothetical protein C5167_026339 [Papaver somniferum]